VQNQGALFEAAATGTAGILSATVGQAGSGPPLGSGPSGYEPLQSNPSEKPLGGFMQGKAALVDGAGHVRYQGSLLAEVFLDNDVHIVVDLDPRGPVSTATPLRLSGAFLLHKDLTLVGALHPSLTLSRMDAQALRVRRPHPISWQAIVGVMRVRYPTMMGTISSGLTPIPFVPTATPAITRVVLPQRAAGATASPVVGSVSPHLTPIGGTVRDASGVRPSPDAAIPLWPFVLGAAVLALGGSLTWRRRPKGR